MTVVVNSSSVGLWLTTLTEGVDDRQAPARDRDARGARVRRRGGERACRDRHQPDASAPHHGPLPPRAPVNPQTTIQRTAIPHPVDAPAKRKDRCSCERSRSGIARAMISATTRTGVACSAVQVRPARGRRSRARSIRRRSGLVVGRDVIGRGRPMRGFSRQPAGADRADRAATNPIAAATPSNPPRWIPSATERSACASNAPSANPTVSDASAPSSHGRERNQPQPSTGRSSKMSPAGPSAPDTIVRARESVRAVAHRPAPAIAASTPARRATSAGRRSEKSTTYSSIPAWSRSPRSRPHACGGG